MFTTRRTFTLATAGAGLAALGGWRWRASASAAMTGLDIPQAACDSHVHIVGDPARFPMDPQRDYTPEPATAADLASMLARFGIERAVIVTPTIYGFNAAATLAAIDALGRRRACGTVFVDTETPRAEVERLAMRGVVGMRLFLSAGGDPDREVALRKLNIATEIARNVGWHLEIATPPDVVETVAKELAASPVPIVFDTFAWLSRGVGQPGFGTIRSLLASGVAYVKLAEPYKHAKPGADYSQLTPLAQAFLQANSDRVLWGSGWPHVPSAANGKATDVTPPLPIDTGRMLRLLWSWAPDEKVRRKILVDNPARIFGFQA